MTTTTSTSHARLAELPLFPLRTVLFPDGALDLKIFEARYLDLMSRCLRERAPFGVVLLKTGTEARVSDSPTVLHDAGTLAELVDVDAVEAGILQVKARGTTRFHLGEHHQRADGLWIGAATPIADDPVVVPGAGQRGAVDRLKSAIATLEKNGARPFAKPHRFDSAGWVANRWCDILPLPLEAKQRLLVLDDPLARLDFIDSLMRDKRATH